MSRYAFIEDEEGISVLGYEQMFTQEDRDDLWATHKILYLGDIMAVWVEEREDMKPLIHLMTEDDGCIFWRKNKDICFDAFWLDDYIKTLAEVKTRLS